MSNIKSDKNKSAEEYIKDAEEFYIIPDLIRTKYPDLIKLIYETESMDEEEREYWMQIMPIMTEDQVVKFREILVQEKDQLSALDEQYEEEMSRLSGKTPEINEEEMKAKMKKMEQEEMSHEELEKQKEDDLLKELENINN